MKSSPILACCLIVVFAVSHGGVAMAEESSGQSPQHAIRGVDAVPGDSLFQLPVTLQTADGSFVRLAELRGRPLVITMFYSHCASVCPLLTAQVQRLIQRFSASERQEIRIVMVSFDAQRDTPEALTAFKAEHHIQDANWIVARATANDVRALAAALGIRYRELADHTFNHSAIVSVTDRDGTVRARTSELTEPDETFIAAVRTEISGTL